MYVALTYLPCVARWPAPSGVLTCSASAARLRRGYLLPLLQRPSDVTQRPSTAANGHLTSLNGHSTSPNQLRSTWCLVEAPNPASLTGNPPRGWLPETPTMPFAVEGWVRRPVGGGVKTRRRAASRAASRAEPGSHRCAAPPRLQSYSESRGGPSHGWLPEAPSMPSVAEGWVRRPDGGGAEGRG